MVGGCKQNVPFMQWAEFNLHFANGRDGLQNGYILKVKRKMVPSFLFPPLAIDTFLSEKETYASYVKRAVLMLRCNMDWM